MIQEIRDIHQSGASMAQIAKRIQHAREEWQEWDKTGEGGNKKLYKIFDQACTRAYQPCQSYFDKQKQQRRQNSGIRKQICQLLEAEFDRVEWRDPDWKKLQQLTRKQSSNWRKTGPADYNMQKPLQQRFDKIMEKFDQRIDRERRRNYRFREKLVADAGELVQQEDVRKAIAEVQILMKQWAPTVSSSRRKEQTIWKQFTESCDKVYEKRNQERKEFTQALKQNLKARQTICAEIEASCQTDTAALPETRSNLAKWNELWEQQGQVPASSVKNIESRFRTAIKKAQQYLAKAAREQQSRHQILLRKKSLVCAEIEAVALNGEPGDKSISALKKLTDRWDSLDLLADELEQPVSTRYQLAVAATTDDTALRQLNGLKDSNLELLHELLLQLEILMEIDSPAEFSTQRMALQIKRLSAAMGKAGPCGLKSAEQLTKEILLVGAVDHHQHVAAFKRFDQCRLKV